VRWGKNESTWYVGDYYTHYLSRMICDEWGAVEEFELAREIEVLLGSRRRISWAMARPHSELTPYSRALLEELIVAKLVKNCSPFTRHEDQYLIHRNPLSSARLIQLTPCFFSITLMFFSHQRVRFPCCFLPSAFLISSFFNLPSHCSVNRNFMA
jgi:hypothetical protein